MTGTVGIGRRLGEVKRIEMGEWTVLNCYTTRERRALIVAWLDLRDQAVLMCRAGYTQRARDTAMSARNLIHIFSIRGAHGLAFSVGVAPGRYLRRRRVAALRADRKRQ